MCVRVFALCVLGGGRAGSRGWPGFVQGGSLSHSNEDFLQAGAQAEAGGIACEAGPLGDLCFILVHTGRERQEVSRTVGVRTYAGLPRAQVLWDPEQLLRIM